jgi:hypothetical protein
VVEPLLVEEGSRTSVERVSSTVVEGEARGEHRRDEVPREDDKITVEEVRGADEVAHRVEDAAGGRTGTRSCASGTPVSLLGAIGPSWRRLSSRGWPSSACRSIPTILRLCAYHPH